MEPSILVIGRLQPTLDAVVEALRAAGRVVVGTSSEDRVLEVLSGGLVDFVAMGGGLDEGQAEHFAGVVRSVHPHLVIHRKGREGGPDAMIPFVNGLAEEFRSTQVPRRAAKNTAHDIVAALEGAAEMDFRILCPFNEGSVGVFHCGPRVSPWERHLTTDEYLHVLEGEVDITVLDEDGTEAVTTVRAGSAFVVQKGLWHRHTVRDRLVELYVTPGGTEHCDDDPRS